MLKTVAHAALRSVGLQRIPKTLSDPPRLDVSEADQQTWTRVRPYTMTSLERILALCDAVRYLEANHIVGDIVECGVWRGGSMMAVALTLTIPRDLYLFDTYAGMPPATEHDVRVSDGASATELLATLNERDPVIGKASLEDVHQNMATTGYPTDRLHYVRGKVEDTVPNEAPAHVALLRLDTDWYESTRHELEHLYPRLVAGGILIIDDYGWWTGARKAVDDYMRTLRPQPFLHRIDAEGRLIVKLQNDPDLAWVSAGRDQGRRSGNRSPS